MDEKNLTKTYNFSIDNETGKVVLGEKELLGVKNEVIPEILKTNSFTEKELNSNNTWKEDNLGCNFNVYSLVPIGNFNSLNKELDKAPSLTAFTYSMNSNNSSASIDDNPSCETAASSGDFMDNKSSTSRLPFDSSSLGDKNIRKVAENQNLESGTIACKKESKGKKRTSNGEGKSSRELHNEKERKRRSRMKRSCQMLRKLVPGVSEKTDKATVLECAVEYLLKLERKSWG